MRRRDFLTATATALAAGCGSGGEQQQRGSHPNVLILYTDEHSAWTLGRYGGALVETPHMDSIGQQGATFRNFFVNSAVCTPSRGCFITGRYPHAHGAYVNNIELNRDEVTLAHLLQNEGYETAMIGKWHLDGEPRPGWVTPERSMGFGECQWMFNRGHWKRIVEKPAGWPDNRSVVVTGGESRVAGQPDGRPDISYDVDAEGEYFTDWITDKAIEFVRRPRENPFFLYLGIPDPHTPFSVRAPYDTMYPPGQMPVPPTLYQENLPDWAEAARQALLEREGSKSWDDPHRETVLRERYSQYCGMVKCIDDNVGRLLGALREMQILDNTLIVFCSDHGQYMGEHGLYFKNQLYETAHRVALMLRWPGRIPEATEIEQCVSTVDVQPTLCALLGIAPSGREQGRDASALATGGSREWRDEAFIHHSSLRRAGVFTPEWELALVKDGDSILFDRVNDPLQVNNLYNDPQHRAVVEELTTRVIEHNREVAAPAHEWLRQWRA